MNENQDNAAQTGEDTPAEAPKKRRAPRKTAAVVAAPVVEVAVPEPVSPVAEEAAAPAPRKRRTTRKTAEAAEPAGLVQAAAPEGGASAAVLAPEVPSVVAVEPAPAPTAAVRAPRSRKKATAVAAGPAVEPLQMALIEATESVLVASVVAAVPEAVPAPVEPAAPAVPAVIQESAAADAGSAVTGEPAASDAEGTEASAGNEGAEGGRRRGRDRDRKGRRERRNRDESAPVAASSGEGPSATALPLHDDEADVVEIVVGFDDDDAVDTGALFAEVVSGEYDAEVEPAPEEEAEAGKRVLRPEPEAPKLHKVLAQAGIGSRREMEQLIEDGQVSVNGEPAHIGMRIAQGDQIRLAGRPIKVRIAPPPARVLAYHKVVGEVVTHHDPEGRPTVFRRLPRLHTGKWLSVGRLDINTEGLLLFTNSGDLANQLMHPRFGVEREYAVRVLGSLTTEQRARLLDGVDVEGQKAAFKSIEDGGGEGVNHWYRVVITEGRNREVRKLFDTVGLAVSRLIRIRYGTVVLPRGLKRGVWVELDDQDVRNIRQLAGNDQGPRPAQGQQAQGRSQGDGQQQRGQGKKPGRGGQGQGQGQGRDRDNQQPRSKGAQHGGDRGGERQERQDRQGGRGGQPGGPQGNPGQGQRPPRGPRPDGQYPQGAQGGGGRGPRGGGNGGNGGGQQGGGEDPLYIPNPLEQTFDKRFVSGSKRITTGFGRPTEEPTEGGNNRKGGPRQPDPMQTSVGYIGAEAYFTRPGGGNNKGRGGRRR